MERQRSSEFETLNTLGLAVRLALHLRGVPPIEWRVLKDVAVHLLNFSVAEVKPAVELLAEADFVLLDREGKSIKTVISQVPYFDDLYGQLGEVGGDDLTEAEQLALDITSRLGEGPMLRDNVYNLGAEKGLSDLVLNLGTTSGFLVERRARGKTVLLSPSSYAETDSSYADLVAGSGSKRVSRVMRLLASSQGWPLARVLADGELGGSKLDADDLAIVQRLAGAGFLPPPAITTSHAGTNHFLFGAPPAAGRLPRWKKSIYDRAMAIVAAVRQGQLLPGRYAIRSPVLLLKAFREKGYIGASTEAWEQYRQVAQLRVARLTLEQSGYAKLELVQSPENLEALDMAIEMVGGGVVGPAVDEQVRSSLKEGSYVEALVGRKSLPESAVPLTSEAKLDLDRIMLGGYR